MIFEDLGTFKKWVLSKRIEFLNTKDIESIIYDIKSRGDIAVREYCKKFDNVELQSFEIGRDFLVKISEKVDINLKIAIDNAKNNIFEYHLLTKPNGWEYSKEGKVLGQIVKPIERVGLYIPGGKGLYPSTILMTAIPAKIAGVKEIVMVTPISNDGLSPVLAYTALACGVDRVFGVGGVQAIAALAFGTETIPKVYKIVGPGNKYVTLAKKFLYGIVDIDSIAGPSEVMILADEYVPLKYIVADMFAQAEHSEDAQSIVIVPSLEMAKKLEEKIREGLVVSKRKDILRKSIENNSAILVIEDVETIMEIVNWYAPEHLQVMMDEINRDDIVKNINNSGAIFFGRYTPVAVGDYYAGPNHTLPTNGTSFFYSALSVKDFIKTISYVEYTRDRLNKDKKDIITLAEIEGFYEHANSIKVRE
ncbi:MAG TPA: histidinol dehydrogenase [Spirochaetota bacterium]|nr:histidinol dehydrogenase [Spirochaetota bacterium]HOM38014.1 histidinol dehydrogenase [Spirochaetota bacterium]HPQ48818.1 histidinol dehydrogenase [Spirochaetota bacterium]